jgi:hypothetical protein
MKKKLLGSLLLFASSFAQVPPTSSHSPVSAGSNPPNYVSSFRLPSPTRKYVANFGKRIQTPGSERTVFAGTYTDKNSTGAATLIWQVPGNIQFRRPDSAPVLTYSTAGGLLNAASIQSSDADVLESLLDDTAEAFFYGFGSNGGYRLLGQRFRADDGKTPDYQGPWYDVYEVNSTVKAQGAGTRRWKMYFFNSDTGRLAMTRYADGNKKAITTQFNNWTTINGESYPQQIVRLENGTTVFTFNIATATIGPAVADGLFSGAP